MFLLILDSIGTWELFFVALVALVVFGPRKIPELARKAGKILHEFRQVSNDFRETWEKEVKMDDQEKSAFDFSEEAISRDTASAEYNHPAAIEEQTGEQAKLTDASDDIDQSNKDESKNRAPEIKELKDPDKLEALRESQNSIAKEIPTEESTDKSNWL